MMTMEQNVNNVIVVGGMIYDHIEVPKQQWVGMIEKVLHSKGYSPKFEEFAKLSEQLKISEATPKQLKTIWWDKYQEMVKGIGEVLSK